MVYGASKKKQKLLDAATNFLSREPSASLNDIAKNIGVGRATLQRYFPKRNDLLREIALDSIHKMDAALAPLYQMNLSAEDGVLKMFEALIPLGASYHVLAYSDLMQFEEVAQAYQQQLSELQQYVQDLKRDGVIALDVPTAWGVQMIDLLIWGAWAAVADGSIAPNDAAQLAFRTLTKGLGKPALDS